MRGAPRPNQHHDPSISSCPGSSSPRPRASNRYSTIHTMHDSLNQEELQWQRTCLLCIGRLLQISTTIQALDALDLLRLAHQTNRIMRQEIMTVACGRKSRAGNVTGNDEQGMLLEIMGKRTWLLCMGRLLHINTTTQVDLRVLDVLLLRLAQTNLSQKVEHNVKCIKVHTQGHTSAYK